MRNRTWALPAIFAWTIATTSGIAIAHPLGNFTINHLMKVAPSRNALRVRYVLDMAEIPTFQTIHAASPDGVWNVEVRERWNRTEAALVAENLRIDVDGEPSPLRTRDAASRLRPGAGGLPTLYWIGDYTVSIAPGAHRIRITDDVYGDRRIGWKDVVVSPQSEPTHELLSYPGALIGSPRRVSGASFDLTPAGTARNIIATSDEAPLASTSSSIVRSNALSDMFSNPNRAPLFVLLTLLVAFGLGALHAIEPGHGKALLAITLVGSRATMRQAAILAAALTFAHTIGVLILGVVLFFAASFVSESIYPWITLASGVAIAFIGARNLARISHQRAHGDSEHHHGEGQPNHHHGDGDTHHSHVIPGNKPIDFRGAIAAAASGGIAPCPAAIVVMLAALRLHQIGYGIVLIVVFSLGLASVLTALGVAVVHGSAWVTRSGRFDRFVAAGPLVSATLISMVGAVMIGQGFVAQGVRAPVWLLALLVALAIAGYAHTPQHVHREAREA